MEPFIQETDSGHKYGLIDPNPQPPNRYRFTLESSRPIHELGPMNYLINLTHDSNCFGDPINDCFTNDRKLIFEDICENFRFEYLGEENYTCSVDDFYNENELCSVLFNPQCEFTQVGNNLRIEFSSPVTDSGVVVIDPTVTFSTNDVEAIEMDVIDRDQYIIIWCDETEDDKTFAVYYTNGTVITSAFDLDTTGGACSTGTDYQVDVAVLNEEDDMAAAVWIGSGAIPTTTTFDYRSPGVLSLKLISISRASAMSVVRLNDTRYVSAWIDSGSEDATSKLFDEKGDNVSSDFDFDTDVGRNARAIAATSFVNDNVNFSVIWFDDASNDIKFITLERNLSGIPGSANLSATIPSVVVDTGITAGFGAVSIDSFDGTRLVNGWLEQGAFSTGIRFSTYFNNGTIITAEVSIDSNPGASESVSVSTLNTLDFVESWHDLVDTDTNFEVWNISGTQLVDKVIAFAIINDGAQQSISSDSEEAICFDRIVVASTVGGIPGGGQTKTFLDNGTIWSDGECETCNYEPGQGNFSCNCEENATLVHNVIIDAGHNLSFTGTGTFKTSYNISNWDKLFQKASCYVRTNAGGGFIQ